jgi:hypothetical protein
MTLEEEHLVSPCYASPNCASAHLHHPQAPRAQGMGKVTANVLAYPVQGLRTRAMSTATHPEAKRSHMGKGGREQPKPSYGCSRRTVAARSD